MNRKIYSSLGLAAVAASFSLSSCKPDLHADAVSAGSLNLARYVAVGNSLTAGYADGSLYRSGQINSYPNMLAQQFRLAGGGDFKIPLLPGEAGWPGLKRVLEYHTDCSGLTSPSPVLFHGTIDTAGSGTNIGAQGPFNNTGIPGIRAIDYLIPGGYGFLNPYAGRIMQNPAGSVLAEINRADATFFTAWIGNNDVLGYATSGGAGKSANGSFLDQNSISAVPLFSVAVDSVLNRMTANGAKGAVMNIPDVTAIPYFTTIHNDALVLRQGQADSLNAGYMAAGLPFRFTAGSNHFLIQDTSVAVIKTRFIRSDEFLLLTLPQDSIKCGGWGTRKPIPMNYVLDYKEVAAVRTATTTFNGILQSAAAARGLAYVDMYSYLRTLGSGISFNGNNFSTTFVSGGAFSLDGVHLTPRGYALAANEMIRTINAYYGSNIPYVDVNSRPGVRLP